MRTLILTAVLALIISGCQFEARASAPDALTLGVEGEGTGALLGGASVPTDAATVLADFWTAFNDNDRIRVWQLADQGFFEDILLLFKEGSESYGDMTQLGARGLTITLDETSLAATTPVDVAVNMVLRVRTADGRILKTVRARAQVHAYAGSDSPWRLIAAFAPKDLPPALSAGAPQ